MDVVVVVETEVSSAIAAATAIAMAAATATLAVIEPVDKPVVDSLDLDELPVALPLPVFFF